MNILKDRLQNSLNNDNIFKHRMMKVIRKGSDVLHSEPYAFKKFNFNGNLHSTLLEDEKFTNYIKSYGNIYDKILTNICDKLYLDNYDFLDEFELDEYEPSEFTNESNRLKRIIMKTNNIKDESLLPKIDKFKPTRKQRKKDKRYDGIRLYVSCNQDGIIDLYLIDLYHLGIDAYNYKTHKYELETHYNNAKDYNKCISKIADNYVVK